MARDSSLGSGVTKRSLGQTEDVGNTGHQSSGLDLGMRQTLVVGRLEAESQRGKPEDCSTPSCLRAGWGRGSRSLQLGQREDSSSLQAPSPNTRARKVALIFASLMR